MFCERPGEGILNLTFQTPGLWGRGSMFHRFTFKIFYCCVCVCMYVHVCLGCACGRQRPALWGRTSPATLKEIAGVELRSQVFAAEAFTSTISQTPILPLLVRAPCKLHFYPEGVGAFPASIWCP